MNYGKEFQKYAMSDHKVSSSDMDQFGKLIGNSMTPYILEEREMRATQLDIFSRLMMDRIIWVSSDVNSKMASIIQAQLMFLDTTDTKDVNLYLDTPGGSVLSGAGMTRKGVAAYRRANPGSKLKTAVTGKVKRGSKAAKRRKSYCARSLGQLKRSSAKTRNDPNSRIRQARRRWKC